MNETRWQPIKRYDRKTKRKNIILSMKDSQDWYDFSLWMCLFQSKARLLTSNPLAFDPSPYPFNGIVCTEHSNHTNASVHSATTAAFRTSTMWCVYFCWRMLFALLYLSLDDERMYVLRNYFFMHISGIWALFDVLRIHFVVIHLTK